MHAFYNVYYTPCYQIILIDNAKKHKVLLYFRQMTIIYTYTYFYNGWKIGEEESWTW